MKNVLLILFMILLLTGCATVETKQSEVPTTTVTKVQQPFLDEAGQVVEEKESEVIDEVLVEEEESEYSVDESNQELASNIKEFDMIARTWEFEPSTITVNKGDTVLLHIQSVDKMHGFGLSAFGVNEYLAPGEVLDIEFLADRIGTFTYLCTIYCGSGHGDMKGQLIVE